MLVRGERLQQWMARLGLPLILTLAAAPAYGQLPRDLIEQALDQPVPELRIEHRPIREALESLGQRTGLRFGLDDTVLDLMPYGARTELSIQVRDMSVRRALGQVFDGLGLEMSIEKDNVAVVPAPWLERLGRRMTLDEVNVLERLSRAASARELGDPCPFDLRLDPGTKPREALEQALAQTRAANALRQLESACQSAGWVWHPEADHVVIQTRKDDVRRRLDRVVELSYQRVPLDEVLVDLGRRVGVTILFEPGALQQVSARDRAVDLIQRGASVRQTLERICGNTGLRYEIVDDGVRVSGPQSAAASAGPTAATIQQWARVAIEIRPGMTVDVFLRVEDLPPEFRSVCERKLAELFSASRPASAAPREP
ncbi:MAG: hypothetical protein HRF50_09765 [Phycisphaerae bacterium]|jgi:hypothetical protein